MMQRANIKDVAAAAGVSYKTVSRVVNGVPTVDPAIVSRVEAAIAELRYVPNTAARSLKTGAGSAIGVVVDSIDDVFFASVVSAIEDRAIAHGLSVLISSTGHDARREQEQLLRLTAQNVRGVILSPATNDLGYFSPYRGTVPLVAIDRTLAGYDSVTVDDYDAAVQLTRLLAKAGHRRIALLGWDPSFITAQRRRAGYESVLAEHGIPLDGSLVPETPFADATATRALDTLLSIDDPPTALFLSNARDAAAAVSTLHALRRTDVAVVSFGDFLLADAVEPAITCIDQDPYEIGATAFDRLLELVDQSPTTDGQVAPSEQRLPTRLVLRQSHRTHSSSVSRIGDAA